jgi:hypothetical protein
LLSLIWNINWAKVGCPSCLEKEKKRKEKVAQESQWMNWHKSCNEEEPMYSYLSLQALIFIFKSCSYVI